MKNRRGVLIALGLLLFLAIPAVRGWFESHMTRHMLVQLPLITATGWLLAGGRGPARASPLHAWNAYGLTGLLLGVLATSFWMIPRAIDAARLLPWAEAAKFGSLLAAGAAFRYSWPLAGRIVQAFFLGNWCWMATVVGLLYQDAPTRLCAVYLADEQINAGFWLVVAALLAFLAWCFDLWWSGDLRRLLGDDPVPMGAADHVKS
ncbi:MAG: hypothetical protein EKK49_08510 [Rhodocyclaceae bacterium]|nr:MAG: hypothetical protein EKK49_08510 [Rhodocyclaceae bacterium]